MALKDELVRESHHKVGLVLGRKPEHETVYFSEVAAGGDERYLLCVAGAAAVVPNAMASSSVFCNVWLCLCVVS